MGWFQSQGVDAPPADAAGAAAAGPATAPVARAGPFAGGGARAAPPGGAAGTAARAAAAGPMAALPAAVTAAKSYVVAQCTIFLRPAPTSNSAPDGWPAVTRRLPVVRW